MSICYSDSDNKLVMINDVKDISYGMISEAQGCGLIVTKGDRRYGCAMSSGEAVRYLELTRRQLRDNPAGIAFIDVPLEAVA